MSGGNKCRRKKCRWNICHLGINVVQSFFYINTAYFELFGWTFSLSANLLFLESAPPWISSLPHKEKELVSCVLQWNSTIKQLNLTHQSSFKSNQEKMYLKPFSLIFLFLPLILALPQKSPVEVRQGLFAAQLCK